MNSQRSIRYRCQNQEDRVVMYATLDRLTFQVRAMDCSISGDNTVQLTCPSPNLSALEACVSVRSQRWCGPVKVVLSLPLFPGLTHLSQDSRLFSSTQRTKGRPASRLETLPYSIPWIRRHNVPKVHKHDQEDKVRCHMLYPHVMLEPVSFFLRREVLSSVRSQSIPGLFHSA